MTSNAERCLRRSHTGGHYFLRPPGASVSAVLKLLDDPVLTERGVTHLTWSGKLGPKGAAELVSSPSFARVRSLMLVDAKIGDEGLASLAASAHARALHTLGLSADAITAAGIGHLLASELRIECLYLEGAKLGPETARAIAEAPGASHLRNLHFQSTKIGDEGALVLGASPILGALTSLSIQDSKLGAKGLSAIAKSETLRSLLELSASAGTVGPSAAKAIASAIFAPTLTRLRLTSIGDDGLEAIARGKLSALESLDVSTSESTILGAGILAIAASASMKNLHRLRAWSHHGRGKPLGDDVVRAIAESPSLATLGDLELGSFGITDDGAKALAASRHLRGLRRLNFFHNAVGDAGVEALVSSGILNGLETLNLAAYSGTGKLTTASARAIASLTLRALTLTDQKLDDAGVAAVASSSTLTLEELGLGHNPVGAAAARALATGRNTSVLRELDLSFTAIGDEGCVALASGGPWRALEELRVANVGMTNVGLDALIAAPWPALHRLEAGSNEGVDDRGKAALAAFEKRIASA